MNRSSRTIDALLRAKQRPGSASERYDREIEKAASACAVQDRVRRFPSLTNENFESASAFQEERIRFHSARFRRDGIPKALEDHSAGRS